MFGFVAGLVTMNALEWVFHKHVLHGLGKKKGSFWAFHWHEHHKNTRKHRGYDPMYEVPLWRASSKGKEAAALAAGCLIATPLVVVSPGFVAATWISALSYYHVHRKSHLDPKWAERWLPWHVDHHLGPNQDANWCVTVPLWDHILGTRVASPEARPVPREASSAQ